jgi:hypothetical protein
MSQGSTSCGLDFRHSITKVRNWRGTKKKNYIRITDLDTKREHHQLASHKQSLGASDLSTHHVQDLHGLCQLAPSTNTSYFNHAIHKSARGDDSASSSLHPTGSYVFPSIIGANF